MAAHGGVRSVHKRDCCAYVWAHACLATAKPSTPAGAQSLSRSVQAPLCHPRTRALALPRNPGRRVYPILMPCPPDARLAGPPLDCRARKATAPRPTITSSVSESRQIRRAFRSDCARRGQSLLGRSLSCRHAGSCRPHVDPRLREWFDRAFCRRTPFEQHKLRFVAGAV
jgi:hypothetical protein